MAKVKFNAEMAIAIAAMLTAVAATVVSVVQTNIMREEAVTERTHARLSVMPAISILYSNGRSENGIPYLELNVHNQGLGPAIVEDFAVYYKGERMNNQRHWVTAVAGGVDAIQELVPNPHVQNSYAGKGRVIQAGDTLVPIHVRHEVLAKKLETALSETEFEICVCSFYGDCQRLNNQTPQPEFVASCVNYREADAIEDPFTFD